MINISVTYNLKKKNILTKKNLKSVAFRLNKRIQTDNAEKITFQDNKEELLICYMKNSKTQHKRTKMMEVLSDYSR